MKNAFILPILFLTLSFTRSAEGQDYRSFRDYAPVLNVEPIVETTYQPVTRRVCNDHGVRTQEMMSIASTIGEDIRRQIRVSHEHGACRTIAERQQRQRITGYRVTYRYGGQTSTARYSYDPGQRIPVEVSLSPQP